MVVDVVGDTKIFDTVALGLFMIPNEYIQKRWLDNIREDMKEYKMS